MNSWSSPKVRLDSVASRYHSGGTLAGRRFDVRQTPELDAALDALERLTRLRTHAADLEAFMANQEYLAIEKALAAGATSRQLAQLTGKSHVTINKHRKHPAGD